MTTDAAQEVNRADAQTGRADAAGSALRREFGNLVADLEDLLGASGGADGRASGEAVRKELAERLASARTAIGRAGAEASERVQGIPLAADRYVRDQPWRGVAIGVGIGFALGVLLSRR